MVIIGENIYASFMDVLNSVFYEVINTKEITEKQNSQ